jgi:hypothetical protein
MNGSMMRRPLLLAFALALSGSATAAPDSSYIAITKKQFGSFAAGNKVTEDALHKLFPTATIKTVDLGGDSAWLLKDPATGLLATAKPTFIEVEAGKIEVYGVEPGDDGAKLAAAPFKSIDCFADEDRPGFVSCKLPWLTVTLASCSPAKKEAIPPGKLKGCKVQEIWWFPIRRS